MKQDSPVCDNSVTVSTEVLGERYEAARKLVEDAKEGLRVAQHDLDQAEVQHRSACNEVKRAEAELREVELDVAGNLDELETAKIAALETTMRSMVDAISTRRVPELLVQAAHAEKLLLGMEEHKTASAAQTVTTEHWTSHDSDHLAPVALPQHRSRSRSPAPCGTSLVGPAADAMETQPW